EVHFHEVGAVDSIVDICAAAIAIDTFGITETYLPYLNEGSGTIMSQHGELPIPVPAVVNIAKMYDLPIRLTGKAGEFITPTGAAIAAYLQPKQKLPESFRIEKSGMGAGKRVYEIPGFLRAMLIRDAKEGDQILKLECNLDDVTGEALGYTMELLMAEGARDVYFAPIYMKKQRPAYLLSVLCQPGDRERMEELIFENTTTIGIRRCLMERTVLERKTYEMQSPEGVLAVKEIRLPNGQIRIWPEYESVKLLAKQKGLSWQDAWTLALEMIKR
nr:LarC family nickel insertion protein [Lachnospiraceae bacterium]